MDLKKGNWNPLAVGELDQYKSDLLEDMTKGKKPAP